MSIIEHENWAGHRKRIFWIYERIKGINGKGLDVGCGAGGYLTIPLQILLKKNNKKNCLYGIDIAENSIELAKKTAVSKGLLPEWFASDSVYSISDKYEYIICSEVLEHLEDEELEKFVPKLAELLKKDGTLIITVPNGYGSYERGQKMWNMIVRFRNNKIVDRIYSHIGGENKRSKAKNEIMTLSDSKHIQFFRMKDIVNLFEHEGLHLIEFTGSVAVSNNVINTFIPPIKPLLKINTLLGDFFPKLASAYYFCFSKGD